MYPVPFIFFTTFEYQVQDLYVYTKNQVFLASAGQKQISGTNRATKEQVQFQF